MRHALWSGWSLTTWVVAWALLPGAIAVARRAPAGPETDAHTVQCVSLTVTHDGSDTVTSCSYTRIGKHIRFRLEHLDELVAAGEQPVTSDVIPIQRNRTRSKL